jgi:hypothetical protein
MKKIKKNIAHINANMGNKPVDVLNVVVQKFANIKKINDCVLSVMVQKFANIKKRKQVCVECGGRQICEHKKRKSRCVECDGAEICEHKKIKSRCVECHGSQICEHNTRRNRCKVCNLLLYLVNKQRSQLKKVLSKTTITKNKSSIEYLDCKIEYFKELMLSKMIDGMNWDNIHIDHIKPIDAFDLNIHEEFLECCHYTNFQPLFGKVNIIKSNKWNKEDDTFWRENIIHKEYIKLYIPIDIIKVFEI